MVTKLTNFGVFVELEPGLEGLLHISELSEEKIESPEEVVKVGDDIEVKVLRVDAKDRKIGLSKRNVDDPNVPEDAVIPDFSADDDSTGQGGSDRGGDRGSSERGDAGKPRREEPRRDLRGGTGGGGPLIQMPSKPE